jgi:CBS domain containing-hemolysin-like protein
MIIFCIALLLVGLALLAILLEKTYFYLPPKELKRQAARGTEPAVTLFRAAAYGTDLRVLLWLVVGLSAAGSFVLFAQIAPPLLGLVVIALLLWLGFAWLPHTRLTAAGAQLVVWCTPAIVMLLRWWHPIGRYLSAMVDRHHMSGHTGMYERDDILDLIDRQHQQSDNRISDEDLERMHAVLQVEQYHVSDIVVPKSQVVAVNIDEQVSPVLSDDLHQSGHVRFPVYESKPSNIVGTLALDVVANIRRQGSVRDYFDEHVVYLHENDTLQQALRAFYETRQHLFIVINNADTYVGIVTLSDILHYLFGAIGHEQFGHFDDRRAVLGRHHHPVASATEEKVSDNS